MNVLSCIPSGNVKQKITDKTYISVDHEAKIWHSNIFTGIMHVTS